MPTGACGINCDVCRLNLLGLCTTCGGGKSDEAKIKLDTQERVLGSTCPVLSCVVMNSKNYCIRDCNQFPCENYQVNPYPFSEAYIHMQKRRREKPTLQMDPWGEPVEVPMEYWDDIRKRDLNLLCAYTLAQTVEEGTLAFQFLDQLLTLDLNGRQIVDPDGKKVGNPLLELICLTYFLKIDRLYPMGKDLISSKDMAQSLYFSGRNALKKEPVLRRFKDEPDDLISAAKALGGEETDLADAAVILYPFPRVPVYYLLWKGGPEYKARLSVLFDRSIEKVFTPPVIWGLVNLLNSFLLTR